MNDRKYASLSRASLPAIEPEETIDFSTPQLPPIALSKTSVEVADLEHGLDERRLIRLATDEVCAALETGARLECHLMSALTQRAGWSSLPSESTIYALHETGEETRHTRAFLRLIDAYGYTSRSPFHDQRHPAHLLLRFHSNYVMRRTRAAWAMLTLVGEEVPDLLQRLAMDAPDTDPMLAAVNRYHVTEEARHLAYARMSLAELWPSATWHERLYMRFLSGWSVWFLFLIFLHPNLYRDAGMKRPWRTWWRVQRAPARVWLRHASCRPVLEQIVRAGALRAGKVPRSWQRLCGVDSLGRPNDR